MLPANNKALIIYDSSFGNTAKIVDGIAKGIRRSCNVKIKHINEVALSHLEDIAILIVGSPTQGGKPTQDLQDFIKSLPDNALDSVNVAAFDTRFAINEHGLGLKLLMKTIGFAANKIASSLEAKGGELIAAPEGFIVEDKEGPLAKNELRRAVKWGEILVSGLIPAFK